MITINNLLEKMNREIKPYINKTMLSFFMYINKEEIKSIKDLGLLKNASEKEIYKYYNVKGIKGLRETNCPQELIKMILLEKELKTLKSVDEMIKNNEFKPTFYINADNTKVKVKQPNFTGINDTRIGNLLGFKYHITFNTITELLIFLSTYVKHFNSKENRSLFFIKDNTLFFDMDNELYNKVTYKARTKEELEEDVQAIKEANMKGMPF